MAVCTCVGVCVCVCACVRVCTFPITVQICFRPLFPVSSWMTPTLQWRICASHNWLTKITKTSNTSLILDTTQSLSCAQHRQLYSGLKYTGTVHSDVYPSGVKHKQGRPPPKEDCIICFNAEICCWGIFRELKTLPTICTIRRMHHFWRHMNGAL